MQVYKVFFKILWQQKMTLMIYIVLFLGLCICFTNTGASNAAEGFSEYGYKIVISDDDQTELSQAMVSYLTQINDIVGIEQTEEKLQDALYARTIVAAIRIPMGFEASLIDGEEIPLEMMTIPGTRYATGIETQIDRYMRPLTAYLLTGMEIKEAINATRETLSVEAKVSFPQGQGGGEHSRAYYFYLYSAYIMMAIFTVGIGPAVIALRKKDLKNRINVSSYPFAKQGMGMILAMLSAGLVFFLLLVILGFTLCGKDYFTVKTLYMVLNGLSFSTVALAVAFLAATFAEDNNILNMIGNVTGLGLSFIGGIFVPMEVMGKGMENVARFVPSYWYVKALEEVDRSGGNIGKAFLSMGIQICFAMVIVVVTFAVMKARKRD